MTEAITAGGRFVDITLFTGIGDEPRLLGSKCNGCATVTFPAQATCPRCASRNVGEHPLAREGELWAFTIQRFAPKEPFRCAPDPFRHYAVGYVNLGDEILVETRIVVDDAASLQIGMPMRLVLEQFAADDAGSLVTFAFTPIDPD